MGVSLLFERKLSLIGKKNDIQLKLTQLTDELMDFQSYASAISEGAISAGDMMTLPSSIFGRAIEYTQASNMYAIAKTREEYTAMMNNGYLNSLYMNNNIPVEQREAFNRQLLQQLHTQALQAFKRQESILLNQKEKALEKKKTSLETQAEEIDAQLQSIDKRLSQEAQNSVPKFGVQ